jgi:Ca2+/Na+ antiporter
MFWFAVIEYDYFYLMIDILLGLGVATIASLYGSTVKTIEIGINTNLLGTCFLEMIGVVVSILYVRRNGYAMDKRLGFLLIVSWMIVTLYVLGCMIMEWN